MPVSNRKRKENRQHDCDLMLQPYCLFFVFISCQFVPLLPPSWINPQSESLPLTGRWHSSIFHTVSWPRLFLFRAVRQAPLFPRIANCIERRIHSMEGQAHGRRFIEGFFTGRIGSGRFALGRCLPREHSSSLILGAVSACVYVPDIGLHLVIDNNCAVSGNS